MLRNAVIAAFAATTLALAAAPAFAGPTETAFLQKLAANWTGKGKLTGDNGGPIACRIVVTAGKQNARFQGRCTIPDMAAQAFNGAITYNDKTGNYESRSSGGTIIGEKHGNTLVFADSSRSIAGTAQSTMTISPSSLIVDFSLTDKKGEKTSARVSFSK